MNRVVDIHGHYLFGVDDGATSLPMSLKLIKMAYDQGARDIYCTSHDGAPILTYERNFKLLKECVEAVGLDVGLHKGCEIYCQSRTMNDVIEKLKARDLLTMGTSKYVLMEFPPWTDREEIYECVTRMRNETQFEPIIAHIERYRFLFDDPHIVPAIIELQVPVQINAYSMVEDKDEERRAFVKRLLKKKLVTFVGSDVHRVDHRPVSLDSGVQYIYENCEKDYASDICYRNAEKMLF